MDEMDDTDSVVDGDYLGAYSRFFTEFVARVNPDDQLPVKVSAYDVNENELVGEVIGVTLQYLNKTYCPPSLQSYIVHLVIQAIKSTCKKQPEICGLRQQEKTYAPLKLMQAVTNEVNEICRRYLDNSRLALLPPPSSTPQVTVGSTRNARRKMEDRHMILHDLHTIFNIQDDTIANYYAVFDGHGGQDAAVYCATHLHQYLVESVHYPTDPEAALRDAFLTTDKQFIAKSNTQKLNGGTTAVCTLLLNKKLYIAWVGDSMASLVSQGNVNQLVNPHRPAREDENERIRNMGGVVVHCMGVLRVNGFLSISRAIGDVPYKPYVSGEPEVRCVSLDGTEDFLIIACDGLWDYVDQRTAALRVYRQVLQNPHDLKHVHQALLQSAKRAGSLDNITVIVVFLTPPVEIALRHSLLTHPAPNGLLLNSMDPNNPVSSNSGQFDMNAAFIKQQQLIDVELHDRADFEVNRAICGMARNGKHQDGDGNDDDYDYSDLGPETDVDAGEDSVDNHLSESFLISSSSSHEFTFLEKPPLELEIHNIDDGEQEDPLRRDNANVCPADSVLNDDRIKLSDRNKVRYDESNNDDDYHGGESRVVETTTSIGPHTFVDDDESPPSPQVVKSLQHALISEAENVADSEDSEDEWNYYRIDPNKKESAAVTTGESIEDIEKQSVQNPESVPRDSSEEVQSSKVEEVDIKCEGSEEKESPSLKLVNIDISYQKDSSESEKKDHGEKRKQADDDDKEDMDFQLNPEAAEFVPLSPPLLNNRNNALQDYPISGSPLKQTPAMDDILIPSQSEFEKEVCLRPKEIDEDFSSDDQQKHAAAACDNNLPDMDVSEISSTKAEVGDDSMARNVSTTQWQTDISQWSTTTRNDTGSDSEEYEIINRDTDPMTMSFTPGALEAAFEKSVDLNAVHELDDSSDDADDNTPPGSPSGQCVNENVLAHTPLSDDKGPIDLLSSSTPHPADNQSTRTATSESEGGKGTLFSAFMTFMESMSTQQQLGVTPLADDRPPTQMESIVSQPDHSQSTNPFEVDNNESLLMSSGHNYTRSSVFDVCTELDCGENLLMKEFDKTQNEGEQMDLREKVDETQFESRVTLSELVQFDSETELLIDQNQDTAILESDNQPSLSGTEYECEEAERPKKRNIDSVGQYLSIGEYEPPSSDLKEDFYPRKNKMLPNDEYLGFKVTLDFSDPAFRAAYDEKRKKEKDQDLKEPCNNHPDKFEKDDDDAAPNNTISSEESKEEETTNDEKQNQPEGQTREEDASSASKSLNNPQTEKIEDISFVKLQVCPVLCEKITLNSCEDISTGKEEETKRETAKATSSASKSSNNAQTEIIEDIPFVNVQARPSGICEAIRRIDLENVFTGFSDIEEETKAMAKVVESTVKAKATTTSTKRPAKTMATTTTKITSTTKTATKATPTSPSKAVSSITSSRTTATSQSATAKKSVAARPKQLTYGSARATVSSTSGKITGTKTTTSSNKTATTTVTTTATKTSVSPRVSTIKSRTNVTVTASSKLSASATSAEKKSTTNKVATTSAKPASTKTTTTTKTTALVANSLASTTAKTSTTSNATSKPRSTSAGTIAKTSLTTSVKSSTTSSRPKTAPSTVSGVKPRESSAKTTPAKSPLIDKQSKDTVNKQISRSSAGGTPSSKTGSRASASLVGNTAAKSRLSVGKSPGKVSETAISPTKKSSLTPKPVSKTTLGAKIASLTESSMMVQNGVPENQVVVEVSKTAVTTATSDKPEDDVPRKDASPVDVPTDNQLIVTD